MGSRGSSYSTPPSFRAGGDANPGRGYRYYVGTPIFNFSHGLSLTNFTLQHTDEPGSLSVRVSNIGSRGGDEVVFAFFSPTELEPTAAELAGLAHAEINAPHKQLFAFERLSLAAGESKVVRFSEPEPTLVDESGRRFVVAGRFSIVLTNGVSAITKQLTVPRAFARQISELPASATLLQPEGAGGGAAGER